MKPEYIVLHTLAFDGSAGIAEVDRWHKERGFTRVGYHYIIRRDGRLETGRHEHEQGAHCRDGGYNRKSLGIAFEGHGDNDEWTDAQWDTIRKCYLFWRLKHGIDPDKVIGHREAPAAKTCPGKKIDMDAVRRSLIQACKDNFLL